MVVMHLIKIIHINLHMQISRSAEGIIKKESRDHIFL